MLLFRVPLSLAPEPVVTQCVYKVPYDEAVKRLTRWARKPVAANNAEQLALKDARDPFRTSIQALLGTLLAFCQFLMAPGLVRVYTHVPTLPQTGMDDFSITKCIGRIGLELKELEARLWGLTERASASERN